MRNNQASYVCPSTKHPLRAQATEQNGQIIVASHLFSNSGTSFSVVDGIPDFTQNDQLSEPAAAVLTTLALSPAWSALHL